MQIAANFKKLFSSMLIIEDRVIGAENYVRRNASVTGRKDDN